MRPTKMRIHFVFPWVIQKFTSQSIKTEFKYICKKHNFLKCIEKNCILLKNHYFIKVYVNRLAFLCKIVNVQINSIMLLNSSFQNKILRAEIKWVTVITAFGSNCHSTCIKKGQFMYIYMCVDTYIYICTKTVPTYSTFRHPFLEDGAFNYDWKPFHFDNC